MALQINTPPATTANLTATTAAAVLDAASVDVAVVSTPPNIDQLLRQISINGTITAAPDNGDVTLSTPLGNFTFSLANMPDATKQQLTQQLLNLLQTQKTVTAVIQPGTPPTQAVLLLPSTNPNTQAAASTSNNQPLPQPQSLSLAVGNNFSAVVLPQDIVLPDLPGKAVTPLPQASSTPQAAPSTNTTNSAPVTAPNAPSQPSAPTAAANSVTEPAPFIPTPPSVLLQVGKNVSLQVDAVTLPNTPAPLPTAPNQISATVVGNGSNGQLIIKAGDTSLYVRTPVEAPVGTNLLLSVAEQKAASPAVLPPLEQPNFNSLQQIVEALAEANPQMAQQLVDSHIPQPNPQLAGPLLLFMNLLKQGDAKSWLGKDAYETLAKSTKAALITKFGHDMAAAEQSSRDGTVGEWKTYPIPMMVHGQFQSITLHVHEDQRDHSSAESSGGAVKHVRFVIDMNMSHLGVMQLDGLVRAKKLDMIVRSVTALPPGLPQDLRNHYLNTLDAMGYTGGLSFQLGKQNWIEPRPDYSKSLVT